METKDWYRHEGKIHQSVPCTNSAGAAYTTTVIGPESAVDHCYVLLSDGVLSFSFHLSCDEAVALGRLLIAVGQDAGLAAAELAAPDVVPTEVR